MTHWFIGEAILILDGAFVADHQDIARREVAAQTCLPEGFGFFLQGERARWSDFSNVIITRWIKAPRLMRNARDIGAVVKVVHQPHAAGAIGRDRRD